MKPPADGEIRYLFIARTEDGKIEVRRFAYYVDAAYAEVYQHGDQRAARIVDQWMAEVRDQVGHEPARWCWRAVGRWHAASLEPLWRAAEGAGHLTEWGYAYTTYEAALAKLRAILEKDVARKSLDLNVAKSKRDAAAGFAEHFDAEAAFGDLPRVAS